MSRGFTCILFGLAVSVCSWYVPYAFVSWPATFVVRMLAGRGVLFQDLPNAQRTAMFVVLLIINSAFWAAIAFAIWSIVQRLTARRRPVEPL